MFPYPPLITSPRKDVPMPQKEEVLVIAEIGINHQSNMGLAKKLIRKAHESGASIAKFQLYDVDTLFPTKEIVVDGRNWYKEVKQTQLSFEQVSWLEETCEEIGIEFLASTFDQERLGWLEDLGVKRHKAGVRATSDRRLLEEMAATGKEVFVSLNEGKSLGFSLRGNIKYLYCVPQYPTPTTNFHLSKVDFSKFSGLSSHYPGIEPAMVAISKGAKVIEVHFCLSRKKLYNPDITSSVEPNELSRLVEFANNASVILGG